MTRYTKSVEPAILNGAEPTTTQLQSIRQRLKGDIDKYSATPTSPGDPNKLKTLKQLLKDFNDRLYNAKTGNIDFGTQLRDADLAMASERGKQRAINLGRKAAKMSSEDIKRQFVGDAANGIPASIPPEALPNFRKGLVYESIRQLDAGNAGLAKKLLSADGETKKVLRVMFPDERSFNSFLNVLRHERSAQKIAASLKRYAPLAVTGGLGAAAYHILFGAK
jgi:hypothetical protein